MYEMNKIHNTAHDTETAQKLFLAQQKRIHRSAEQKTQQRIFIVSIII